MYVMSVLKEYDNFWVTFNASKQNGEDESKTHHEKAAFLKRLKVARLT